MARLAGLGPAALPAAYLALAVCLALAAAGKPAGQRLGSKVKVHRETAAEVRTEHAKEGHRYGVHDRVPLLLNKIGPFNNPHETYRYLHLGFCSSETDNHDMGHSLGQLVAGDRKVTSGYRLHFLVDKEYDELCSKRLTRKEMLMFRRAVEEEYYFEMFLDGLPMWGFIGDYEDDFVLHRESASHHYIFTKLDFTVAYHPNDDGTAHIVGVNVTADFREHFDLRMENPYGPDDELIGDEVTFAYSVKWKESSVRFEDRNNVYDQEVLHPGRLQIHWFAIVNSCVLVFLLAIFVGIILVKVLRSDIASYLDLAEDDLDADDVGLDDAAGWKLVHGDVFRAPEWLSLFCACVGVGMQMFVLTMALLMLALLGITSASRRGAVATCTIVLYVVTSFIAGYVSSSLYRQLAKGAGSWVWNALTTIFLFPVPVAVVFAVVNSTAWANGSTSALPAGTIIIILCLWGAGAVPLSLLGSIAGRNLSQDLDTPCRVHKVARQIPPTACWRNLFFELAVSALLCTSAIYIEMNYIFEAMWGHKIYTLFGILFLAMWLLVIVSCVITVVFVYFRLAAENYHWWWASIFIGGSVSYGVALYSLYFAMHKSQMSGFQQLSTYAGYVFLMCFALFLALGSLGFFASLRFVRIVFSSIKCD